MVYDITDPAAATFVTYHSDRTFVALPPGAGGTSDDLGPEGLVFVPADESPNGVDLLIVGNEISGSTAIYAIDPSEPVANN